MLTIDASLRVEELVCPPPMATTLWRALRQEAQDLWAREPFMRPLLDELILPHTAPHQMVLAVVARSLSVGGTPAPHLRALMAEALMRHLPEFEAQCEADLRAIKTRDPACPSHLHGLLNLKGFHTLVVHRAARRLWQAGRRDMALWLSNQAALVYGADIHPGAQLGQGLMLDHATGIVIGETATVGDDVSILQNVTLGGTGKNQGDRHPKVREGVMIGAGATVLGNIEIGAMSKIAAGSVVLQPVPARCTVAGVPAKVVRKQSLVEKAACPAVEMNQGI